MNRQFLLAARPRGWVKESDFSYQETAIPVCDSGQILVRTKYISLDPSMRGQMENRADYAAPLNIGDVMRASGCPVAYLVGFKEFYSLRFDVSEHVLIPRPETEFVVIAVLDIVKEHFNSDTNGQSIPCHVVDVGTGSGAIAITLATELSRIQVTAVDLSTAAL